MRISQAHETFEEFLNRHGVTDGLRISSPVGRGWWPIVSRMFKELKAAGWDGEVSQIKEKMGKLRVYLTNYDEHRTFDAIIAKAEEDSGRLCHECSMPAKEAPGDWFRMAECDDCRSDRQRKLSH